MAIGAGAGLWSVLDPRGSAFQGWTRALGGTGPAGRWVASGHLEPGLGARDWVTVRARYWEGCGK